jgi:hypothetical protein
MPLKMVRIHLMLQDLFFTYRRVRGTLFWHFRENCPMWPTEDYEEVQNAEDPPAGAFCIQCAQLPNPWLFDRIRKSD